MMQVNSLKPDECANAIRDFVGNENLGLASSSDAIDGVQPAWIVEPGDASELSRVLSFANQHDLKVIVRGGGSKLDWGNVPRRIDLILSTRRLNRVLEHAASDMTATVQAGCTIDEFQQTLAKQGQRLALDPLWPDRATIGGILATNDSGPLRFIYGSLRDLLIGITIALPDGTLARSGGKVVKNVAGYDLPKLLIGSFGTLGVIVEATFRLHPLPLQTRDLRFETSVAQLPKVFQTINQSSQLIAAAQLEFDDNMIHLLIRIEALAGAIQSKCDRVIQAIAQAGGNVVNTTSDAWSARQRLFEKPNAVACKVSILPTEWPRLHAQLRSIASQHGAQCNLIAQATGLGLLSVSADEAEKLLPVLIEIRRAITSIGGSLVVLRCPMSLKAKLDVWPEPGDAIIVMRKLKEQFDPNGTLSPGRFIGGI